jgi:hypothetical protein
MTNKAQVMDLRNRMVGFAYGGFADDAAAAAAAAALIRNVHDFHPIPRAFATPHFVRSCRCKSRKIE